MMTNRWHSKGGDTENLLEVVVVVVVVAVGLAVTGAIEVGMAVHHRHHHYHHYHHHHRAARKLQNKQLTSCLDRACLGQLLKFPLPGAWRRNDRVAIHLHLAVIKQEHASACVVAHKRFIRSSRMLVSHKAQKLGN